MREPKQPTRPRAPHRIPLRIRLSLGSAFSLALAIAAFALIAYQQARRAALDGAAARARAAAISLANRSSLGLLNTIELTVQAASEPAIVEAVRTGTITPAAQAILARFPVDTLTNLGTGLRTARGEMLFATRADLPTAFDETLPGDTAGVGRIRMGSGAVHYEITAPVRHGGQVIGSLVRVRRVANNPAAIRLINDLLSENGALLFGNADGSLWTDFTQAVEGPSDSAGTYRKGGEDFIFATQPIGGTPFMFAAEFPERAVLAPVRRLARDFTIIGLIIVALALLAGLWANARVTRPLTELTQRAEGITTEHRPNAPPAAPRGDELDRLQQAFDTMADSVWQARVALESRVLERTRALEELKATEDALRLADRRKDEFLATLAHELRNPLAPIRNAAHVLKLRNPSDPDLQHSRDIIERQVTQMGLLLDDLLDLSRVSNNRLELRLERVDLRAVLKSAIETSRPLIDAGGHELTVVLPSAPVELEADAIRLAQVFSNLLNNSAKYSVGRGNIRVAAEMHGDSVTVTVSDDGIGITPEALPHIWDMFTQARPALNQSRSGLGIGLSLVKGLVELHGGSVSAESDGAGRGSTFTVRLPVAASAPVAEAMVPAPSESAQATSRKILVADDMVDNLESMATLLGLMGHTVWAAQDGAEAFALAEVHRPELVLLDLGMPRMDGYEACRRIREQPWSRDMTIVAVTGWGQKDDRRKTGAAGFDHHMVKPVDANVLVSLLDGNDRER
jgi:signal transduction histidine kinase/ActR/RegA family two-component response regulator